MDGKKKEKVRRIYAWIAIILFIALIINISTVQWQLPISIGVYILIIMYYLFFLRKDKNVTTREYTQEKNKAEVEKDNMKSKLDSTEASEEDN